MPATDVLKNFRQKNYASTSTDDAGKGMDSEKPNETPRIIKLTDEEAKAFANAKPGEDLACEVHGSMDGEGGFRVMSVGPMPGGNYGGDDEQKMAGQVMQRVVPNVAPSPS